ERIRQHGFALFYAGNHVGAAEPVGFGEIGRRPSRRVIRMRVVEANDVLSAFAAFTLDADQVFGIDVVTVVCGIRPRIAGPSDGSHDAFVTIHPAEQNSTAFVRICFFAVAAESSIVRLGKFEHADRLPIVELSDLRIDKLLSVWTKSNSSILQSDNSNILPFFPEPLAQIFVARVAQDGHKNSGLVLLEL